MLKKILGFLFKFILLPILLVFAIFYIWGSSSHSDKDYYTRIESYEYKKFYPNDTFSVMTYNIGFLSGMTNNLPVESEPDLYQSNLEKAIELISTKSPDFVGFQEIDFDSKRSLGVNQLDKIGIGAAYPYGAVSVNWDKNYVPFPYWPPAIHYGKMLSGQAILSKYSFVNNRRITLEKPKSAPFYYNAFYLDRLIQIVQVDVGRPLILINVHLEAFDQETRESQAEYLLEVVNDYTKNYPVILMGDFNSRPPFATEQLNNEKTISLFLENPYLEVAVTKDRYLKNEQAYFTFSSGEPYEKLDYIFYTKKTLKLLSSDVIKEAGEISDHLPVMMEFTFVK
ncbi:MAG: endonuclease/exonuclease/phosphatase family protein [Bacteroidota bacterium]